MPRPCSLSSIYQSISLLRRILILISNRRAEDLSFPLRWDSPSFLTKHHWGKIKISFSNLVANYLDDEFKISSAEKNSVSIYIRGNSSLKSSHTVNTIKEFLRISISSIFYADIYCQNSRTSSSFSYPWIPSKSQLLGSSICFDAILSGNYLLFGIWSLMISWNIIKLKANMAP